MFRVSFKQPLVPRCPPVPIWEALIAASSLILIAIVVVAVPSVHHLMKVERLEQGAKENELYME